MADSFKLMQGQIDLFNDIVRKRAGHRMEMLDVMAAAFITQTGCHAVR